VIKINTLNEGQIDMACPRYDTLRKTPQHPCITTAENAKPAANQEETVGTP
jgi:hypothetical protein